MPSSVWKLLAQKLNCGPDYLTSISQNDDETESIKLKKLYNPLQRFASFIYSTLLERLTICLFFIFVFIHSLNIVNIKTEIIHENQNKWM